MELLELSHKNPILFLDRFFKGHNQLKFEKESIEYWALNFELNNYKCIFRKAKITPTKIGQFVTIWKRNQSEITIPLDENDDFDYLIIATLNENRVGYFKFPKIELIKHHIITATIKTGKNGIRVYPPWDICKNKQAIKSQLWQLNYFISLNNV